MRRLIALGALALVVVLLVVAQLVLPGIAAQRLRDQLARTGQVLDVRVSAFPAIELLWHHADTVVIRLGRYRTPPSQLGHRLGQSDDVGTLDASAQEVDAGLVTFHDARLRKQGDQLTATATIDEADLRSAVPLLSSVTPVDTGDGRLVLRGTATVLGVSASVDAVVQPENGTLVVTPQVPFGGLGAITVFSDPHVRVQTVNAKPVTGGFSVAGSALVR
jgi:hypothetical protein